MKKEILKTNNMCIYNKPSLLYLILGIVVFFGCTKKETESGFIVDECENEGILKSVTIVRCVDAYVEVDDGELTYIGTHCWNETVGGGTGFGPGWSSSYTASSFYTPDGYPSSEYSGSSGNSGSFSVGSHWIFEFNKIERTYSQNSTLNLMEKQKLCDAIDATSTLTMHYNKIVEYLINNDVKIIYKVGPTQNNVAAQYQRDTITFRDADAIIASNLAEEFVHAVQNNYYGSLSMDATLKNCEYEAKIFTDLSYAFQGGMYAHVGSMGMDQEFMNEYSDWILMIVDRGAFLSSDRSQFDYFCQRWTIYSGTYKSTFAPRLLVDYFRPY